SVKTLERWDRIGYIATQSYEQILQWIVQQREQYHQQPVTPASFLYKAIQDFVCKDKNPSYQELAALRELIETAQHYWEIDTRLKTKNTDSYAEFIKLLQRGTITANSDPVRYISNNKKTVTLATIFQYRASKKNHRWHFWLDIGSPLWSKGGAATLFGA
ncbi:MAG: recombinase family protein, partial [Dolichospermum sp.]